MRLHFMGIAGSGASGVASICEQEGWKVNGCDLDKNSPYLTFLKKKKIEIFPHHSTDHLSEVDKLIISPSVLSKNPKTTEITAAKKLKIPILTWQQFLGRFLIKNKFVIAIAGTHGKSTTTAMIAFILEKAFFDPTVILGAIFPHWGTNFRLGKSKYFVIEADEYANNFLNYNADIVVITNIDYDHPEYFKTEKDFKNSFEKFVLATKKNSTLILGPDLKIENKNGKTYEYKRIPNLKLLIPGQFNKINAALAIAVAEILGIKESGLILSKFKGLSRRFEFKGEVKNIKVFDDYAHHPTEIAATLTAARDKFPKNKIWCVFQPHMYTRTKVLFSKFVKVFENSKINEIILVDIFAARQRNFSKISSFDLAISVKNKKVKYIGELKQAAKYLIKNLSPGDILMVLGAGDIYLLSNLVLEGLKKWQNLNS